MSWLTIAEIETIIKLKVAKKATRRKEIKMFESLKRIRKNKGISAEQMQELLEFKTKAAYYKKESGIVKFTLCEAIKISEYIEMPIEDIFFNNDTAKMETS